MESPFHSFLESYFSFEKLVDLFTGVKLMQNESRLAQWAPPAIGTMNTPNKSTQVRKIGDVRLIVVHTAEAPKQSGVYRNVAAWLCNPKANASAHYSVGRDGIIQCCDEKWIAWHASQANPFSIGIEHEGYAKQTEQEWSDEWNQAMLDNSAWLVAQICNRWNIPPIWLSANEIARGEKGICGHRDVNLAFNKGQGHTDPGPSFPFTRYIELINEHMAFLQK